jgi:hypothetical protein
MSKVSDVSTLKLTTDDAVKVWCLEGSGLPAPSGLTPLTFVRSDWLREARCVRVIGSAGNAYLLTLLGTALNQGRLERLEVCSPLVCESADGRRDPELVLYYMRNYNLSASLGGWHDYQSDDHIIYRMVQMVQNSPYSDHKINALLRLAVNHPVWPALQFLSGLSEGDAAQLLAVVIDPRWYIDTDEPNRSSRLEQYLGLTPKTIQAVLAGDRDTWLHDRCQCVIRSWLAGQKVVMPRVAGKTGNMPGVGGDISEPRNFLGRIFHARKNDVRGYLAASRHFISYLRHNWLNVVTGDSHRGRLFVPEHFFHRSDEVVAYKKHMTTTPTEKKKDKGT